MSKKYDVKFDLKGLKVDMVMKEYVKKGSQWKLIEVTTQKNISSEEYNNIFNSIDFFRGLGGYERVTKNYTCIGYIPMRLNSISPNRSIKIVREFRFYIGK